MTVDFEQRVQEEIYGELCILRQDTRLTLGATARSQLDGAFLVPPNVFEEIWKSHHEWTVREPHSIILTIPAGDHVASAILSIPRDNALDLSYQYSLQGI